MHEQANKQHKECLRQLSDLPQLLLESTADVVQRISRFSTDVQAIVQGHNEDKSFVHRSRDAFRSLRWAIRRTAPDFRPFEDPTDFIDPGDPDFQRADDDHGDRMDKKYAIDSTEMVRRRTLALAKKEQNFISLSDVRDVIKRSVSPYLVLSEHID